jgi:excisionase family DNA binding protein
MTADDAAVFLGVDRNTVYDFAGRGVIPHQRLGKRLLFRRGTLVAWLDASLCKATSTRKG